MIREYKYLGLFLILSILFSMPLANAEEPKKVIVIDAGHGGVDPGVVVGNVYEKDINLQISLVLKKELEKNNFLVLMTREGDYDLGTPKATYRKKSDFDHRISLINSSKADYYVSIHLNYLSDSSYYGPQVFYSNKKEVNKEIASKIQDYLNQKLNSDREIKKIPNSIYMYSKLDIPGVLIECGFLSNAKERELLLNSSYVEQFAVFLVDVFKNL